MKELFEQLKNLGWQDEDIPLASEPEIEKVEKELGITFPIAYKTFAKEYLNIGLRGVQFLPFNSSEPMYLINELNNARTYFELPNHLIPFINNNDDYYCFDLKSNIPDYKVAYWSHNGTTNEKWDNFLDWMEKCLIGEYLQNKSKYDFE
ncbi:SMI1/KNR4 family protein [Flectobacillus major]|uniref:SMI1/KNR4 family protein n=1 Tax=Flectobacillus major TaxID=103 RepID=UPI0003F4C2D7|nr:SMI1/KNR4 family protein [Flectobacillus major]